MKKIISLIFLGMIVFSCSFKPEDPMITPPGYKEIPQEKDVEKERKEIKKENNEELEKLKKIILLN